MADHGHGNTGDGFGEGILRVRIHTVEDTTVENIGKGEGSPGVRIERSPWLSAVTAGGEIVHSIVPSPVSQEGV